jgi:uncharacterized protein with von Willebrand factor type A (vWA) domain
MQSSLLRFVDVLRSHSLPVSPAETLDAATAMDLVGYGNRGALRDALAATLAKSQREEEVFDDCFARFFDQRASDFSTDESENASGRESSGENVLLDAADPGDAAGDGAGDGEGQGMGGGSDAQRLAEAAGESPALARLLEGELLPALLENQRGALSGALRRYRDVLRGQVRDLVGQQYLLHAEGRNDAFMDDVLSRTRLANVDRRHVDRVREQVRRMARRLAARHSSRRRRVRRGQLHMGRTLRAGVAHDGVLFQTHWRARKRDKAQVMALCDVSGSVAAYAGFLLMFLYSLQDVLPRMRSFAFSHHLGEVSELFETEPLERAIELANWRFGGATDYGGSLRDFARLALDDINRSTSVIILGDARNNRGNPELDVMHSIYQRSKQVLWLNPEPRSSWGTGDSEMLRYQSACHFSAPCGNLQQLERVIDQLLKSVR